MEPDQLNELIQLSTKDVMGDGVVSTIRRIKEIGKKQHNEFCEMRIFNKRVPFDRPVQKNKLPTFKASNTKGQSAKSESKDLKIRMQLFSQRYIFTQNRGGNMLEFFNHETLQYLPALTKGGEMGSREMHPPRFHHQYN